MERINDWSSCNGAQNGPVSRFSGGCTSRGVGHYAGFWCGGSCSGTLELPLPRGFDTVQFTVGMHYDNANCRGIISVGHTDANDPSGTPSYETVFDNTHFADRQTVTFTYRPGDTLRVVEEETCIVHLYELKVRDSTGEATTTSRLSVRGDGAGSSTCRPIEEELAVRCCADAAQQAEAVFCKACSASSASRPGDTCWGVLPASDTRRGCGCNSGSWQGSGVYYGGSTECNQCGCWGGGFAGHRENGEPKGGLPSEGLTISVYSPPTASLEVGQTHDIDHHDVRVALRHSYANPAIIVGIPSYDGRHEVALRIREVTSASFTMYLDEPICRDNWHMHETVSWMAVEAGVYGSLQAGTFA